MSKKKNKKVNEENENNHVEENNREENGGDSQKSEEGEKKDGGGGGGKNAVVLKIDLHCEGCVSKIIKRIRAFEGVVNVELDVASQKFSVTGKVDPVKLRDTLQKKLNKKVELLTPVPKKTEENCKGKDNGGGAGGKDDQKKKADEKNAKEPPVTTAVLKVLLHCEGCIQKINKIITKTRGYQEMKMDREKDLVTVTGAMDMKALVESLKKHLKKDVEIVPPKKDEKKDKENGNGGGEKANTGNKMQVQVGQGYPMMMQYAPNGPEQYAYQYGYQIPQMFSDENPNACSIM